VSTKPAVFTQIATRDDLAKRRNWTKNLLYGNQKQLNRNVYDESPIPLNRDFDLVGDYRELRK